MFRVLFVPIYGEKNRKERKKNYIYFIILKCFANVSILGNALAYERIPLHGYIEVVEEGYYYGDTCRDTV